jgi:hypothetical protein
MSEVLSYRYPPINPASIGNQEQWWESKPTNGSVFRSDQNQSIIINMSSNSQYLKTVQSFLTGTLVARAANGAKVTDASTRNTKQGISRAFSRLIVRFGGAIVEDIHNYSDALALTYALESVGRKKLLTKTEGYAKDDVFTTAGSFRWAHMLLSSLWVTDQLLPLPFITVGGISLEIFLAPANEVFTTPNVEYYTLENISFKWQAVTPDPNYTLQMRSAIAQGRSAYIAYQRLHSYPSNGNGANDNILNVPIGQVSSIVGIETVFWDSTTYAASDKYSRFKDAQLKSWSIEASGLKNPHQIDFQNEADPETALMAVMTQSGNIYRLGNDIDFPDNYMTENFRVAINYQSSNEYFGTGISTIGAASPFLTIRTKHNAPVQPTTNILTFVTTDALVEFRGTGITVTEVF